MHQLLPAAVQCFYSGQFDQAEALLDQVLRDEPQNAEVLHLLGQVAHLKGKHALAVDSIKKAIALDPHEGAFHCNLGLAYKALGQMRNAAASFQWAVKIQPDLSSAHSNLAATLNEQGYYEAAESYAREALRLSPRFADAFVNLGNALYYQEKVAEAEQCFHTALEIQPQLYQAHVNLGHSYQQQGKFAEAEKEYEEALRHNPREIRALHGLSLFRQYSSADHVDRERIETLLKDPAVPAHDRKVLYYTLAKIFDDAGKYDEAFQAVQQAKALERPIFDRKAHSSQVDRIMALFSRSYLEVSPSGSASELPVFIVGMPRSGTTLVEQILASHPRVHACGELNDIENLIARLPGILGLSLPYPQCVYALSPDQLRALAEEYLSARRQVCQDALRSTDKMPTNFMHLGLIARLFPKARVIHCRRQPLDVCLSCYLTNFVTPLACTYDLADLGFYYRQYEKLMGHWQKAVPLRMLEVPYENLVRDQQAVTRQILEFCGLPWDERCLHFHENDRVVRTSSSWQVRQPIYVTAVDRWKNYARHLEPLQKELEVKPAASAGITSATILSCHDNPAKRM